MKKSLRLLTVITVSLLLFCISSPVFASHKSISFKEGIHILRKNGYVSEIAFPKLRSRTSRRTVIWTYPGAQGMDKISLRPIGNHYVRIHAIFGTLHGGHFHILHYPYAPHYKTVRR